MSTRAHRTVLPDPEPDGRPRTAADRPPPSSLDQPRAGQVAAVVVVVVALELAWFALLVWGLTRLF